MSRTSPTDSASVIPQSPISDLESEWTVDQQSGWIILRCGKQAIHDFSKPASIAQALVVLDYLNARDAALRSQVKPLVEALEKIVASHSPAEYACQIGSEALAQLKPETKL